MYDLNRKQWQESAIVVCGGVMMVARGGHVVGDPRCSGIYGVALRLMIVLA
jgi:hypothetical protein